MNSLERDEDFKVDFEFLKHSKGIDKKFKKKKN